MLSKSDFCPKKMTPGSSPGLGSPLGRTRHSSSQSDLTTSSSSSSGLSFTACMSDFSLYVFHPYGAGKQKSAVTVLTPGSGALGTEQLAFMDIIQAWLGFLSCRFVKDYRR